MKNAALAACAVVNVYVLLASLYLALRVYPRFGEVAPAEWSSAYHAFTRTNGFAFVPWELLAFVLTVVLYFVRPEAVPVWVVHVAAGCGVAYFVVTFGWHLPAHRLIETKGNDPALLGPLLTSHWIRTVLELPRVGVLVWAMMRLLL